MKLRKIFLTLAALCSFALSARDIPAFSSGDSENWYYILFDYGTTCFKDYGAGETVYTRYVTPGDQQLQWLLIGDADSFILKSRQGNYATFSTTLKTSANQADATTFSLKPSSHPDYTDSWEISIVNKGDEYDRFNHSGGPLPGRSVKCWTPGDALNAISFKSIDALPSAPVVAPQIAEYKIVGKEAYSPQHRHTLWYRNPVTAENVIDPWMEYALPIGNGDFGAMVYGGIHCDRLQFNDKSLWSGSPRIRGSYQNFGDLYIEDISDVFGNTDDKAVKNYVRNLDLAEGKANVYYTSPDGGVAYTREYIASYPDKVVALKLAADKPGAINVRISLFPGVKTGVVATEYADGGGAFREKLDYLDFKAAFKVISSTGDVKTGEGYVEVKNADDLVILLAGATNFNLHSPDYRSDAAAMETLVDSRLNAAADKGWDAILADHIADYSSLFGRASFTIGAAQNTKTVEEMVTNYNKRRPNRLDPANLMLEELYYAFGRYLLIASSRGMDLPANLQGIWNHSDNPAWQCDIHSNINVQMNYWPAEITNLSELHMPFLNYVYTMALEHGEWAQYARRSGQTKGWTCFTQNNIFGYSDYAENYVIANAWYSYHLWQHYKYTLDREFLHEKAFPVMRSCAEFWLERLVKDSDGLWVAPQEWSPEHGPAAEDATAHAQQIIYELFASTTEAMRILGDEAGVTEAFKSELSDKFANLDKGLAVETYNGEWNDNFNGITPGMKLLREWKTSDFTAGEKEHRHQSHLMAMYPYSQITPDSEFFEPAVNSLAMRGDVSTGWSLGWRINLWARALDGTHAHALIVKALRHATTYGQSSGGGGIYYNLLDSHAPFQIDGNFGYTAGVTEMLLQSYNGVIRLLPALPSEWVEGSLDGIRAEGDFTVSQQWENGTLTEANILSGSGKDCVVTYKGISTSEVRDANGTEIAFTVMDDNTISFPTVAGSVYNISYDANSLNDEFVSDIRIIFDGSTAVANRDDAQLSAYSLAGVMLASARGTLDLTSFSGTPLIVKAVHSHGTAVAKIMVR